MNLDELTQAQFDRVMAAEKRRHDEEVGKWVASLGLNPSDHGFPGKPHSRPRDIATRLYGEAFGFVGEAGGSESRRSAFAARRAGLRFEEHENRVRSRLERLAFKRDTKHRKNVREALDDRDLAARYARSFGATV